MNTVSCGFKHTAFIASDSNLYTIGANTHGQLGLAFSKNNVDSPRVVDNFKDGVEMVACGYNHTLVLTRTGQIFGMGSNMRCELGVQSLHANHAQLFFTPIQLMSLDQHKITKIIAGSFSAAITD